jgi:hypothetical protein
MWLALPSVCLKTHAEACLCITTDGGWEASVENTKRNSSNILKPIRHTCLKELYAILFTSEFRLHLAQVEFHGIVQLLKAKQLGLWLTCIDPVRLTLHLITHLML